MLSHLALAFLLTGCVEDVATDKVEAVVEDAEPVEEKAKEPAPAAAGDAWTLVKEASTIKALGAKVTATHPIDFHDWDAKVTVDGDTLTSLSYTVQMASLEADHPKLTAHLKDADFFDVATYPESTFVSTKVSEGATAEGMTHTVEGTLTIRGTSKNVTFPAKVSTKDGKVMAETEFAINRQDFGITYPGKKDDLIQDNVVLTVKVVAQKPA
jgi:polyisoprenoid-binding protein YceI